MVKKTTSTWTDTSQQNQPIEIIELRNTESMCSQFEPQMYSPDKDCTEPEGTLHSSSHLTALTEAKLTCIHSLSLEPYIRMEGKKHQQR